MLSENKAVSMVTWQSTKHTGDMSEWVMFLLELFSFNFLTECYSETESEGESSPSPRRKPKVSAVKTHKHTLKCSQTHI